MFWELVSTALDDVLSPIWHKAIIWIKPLSESWVNWYNNNMWIYITITCHRTPPITFSPNSKVFIPKPHPTFVNFAPSSRRQPCHCPRASNMILNGTKNYITSIHYNDVIMSAIGFQITSFTIVYLTLYAGADQRKHQRSSSLASVREIHRWPVNSPHQGPVTRKMFPFDDVIMTLKTDKVMITEIATMTQYKTWPGQYKLTPYPISFRGSRSLEALTPAHLKLKIKVSQWTSL